ncbi:hypothetical protein ACFQ1I_24590 [Kitasatospora arboriphila]
MIGGFRAQLGLSERVSQQVARRVEEVLLPGAGPVWERFDAARPCRRRAADPGGARRGRPGGAVPPGRRLQAAYGGRVRLLATRGLGHQRVLTDPAVLDNVLGFLTEPDARAARPADRIAGATA